MKTDRDDKITNWLIVGLMFAGALLVWTVADMSATTGIMTKIFVSFLGAVIVVQVMPALMLLGALLKGLYEIVAKKTKEPLEESKK